MTTQTISRPRLVLNAVGCIGIAMLCLPVSLSLATGIGSLTPPKPDDPDGGMALALYTIGIVFCGLLGLAALISLMRSVKQLRGLRAASDESNESNE